MRELGLAAPGTDEQLAEQVARIVSRPLDRGRPLWELYLISGLRSGDVAMLTKIHHAVIDGMSGAEIMGLLLDLTPEIRTIEAEGPWATTRPSPVSSGCSLAASPAPRGTRCARSARCPRHSRISRRRSSRSSPASPRSGGSRRAQYAIARQDGGVERTSLDAPKTSFNGRVSPHRRFTFGQLSLDDVKAVKNVYGCTVNDVVVSICAGAVRRWLLDHDELPEDPLVAQIPISVRTEEQMGTYGNRIMLMASPLHTEIADPVERRSARTSRSAT